MYQIKKFRRFLKKAIAVTLGLTMVCGALMLPGSMAEKGFSAAYADTVEANGCKFIYSLYTDNDTVVIVISGVEEHGDTVEIPSYISHNGYTYCVSRISNDFLKKDNTVKTVIFPDTIKSIGMSVLDYSSVENIILPDGLESLGNNFAEGCKQLKSVKYTGTSIKNNKLGSGAFYKSDVSSLTNEQGAVCFGNWLLSYTPDDSVTSIKFSDIENNGIKIEHIAYNAFPGNEIITSVDLEGIKSISNSNLLGMSNLTEVLNSDEVEYVERAVLRGCPWFETAQKDGLVKIGKTIFYYRTDDKVIDLTSGQFEGTKKLDSECLADCKNLETLKVNSDCELGFNCFYTAHEQTAPGESENDKLPLTSTYKLKNIYVDGKKVTYKLLTKDETVYSWAKQNFKYLLRSDFTKDMVIEKTKEIFKQMDIPFLGIDNKEFGMYTPEEEFYIRLKVHNYVSMFDYDMLGNGSGYVPAILMGGNLDCRDYAFLIHFFLQCAGVECKTLHWNEVNAINNHFWNSTKIGDEWFESDDGWDAQASNHGNNWYMLSSSRIKGMTYGEQHNYFFAFDDFHTYPNREYFTEREVAERTLGDLNSDDIRDQTDVDLLWGFLKTGERTYSKKRGDINFDGSVDVTDAVLLDNFVNGKAIDTFDEFYDGYAPRVKVAFINGDDYDHIEYRYTDRNGYIALPELFEAPEGKKLRYDRGIVGLKVRVTDPLTVIHAEWIDKDDPGYIRGDVNSDGTVDIEDAVSIIQYINGITPLTEMEEFCADVTKDKIVDIDDAVQLISYINGNSTF